MARKKNEPLIDLETDIKIVAENTLRRINKPPTTNLKGRPKGSKNLNLHGQEKLHKQLWLRKYDPAVELIRLSRYLEDNSATLSATEIKAISLQIMIAKTMLDKIVPNLKSIENRQTGNAEMRIEIAYAPPSKDEMHKLNNQFAIAGTITSEQ